MIAARIEGGRKTAALVRVRDAADALKSAVRVRVRNADGALKLAWQAVTAAVSRTSVEGFGDSSGSIAIQTAGVLATPSGGTGPFTYAWTQTGGDPATILTPNAASTAFRFASVDPGSSKVGNFACTITDTATGASATSPSVTATATNVNTA